LKDFSPDANPRSMKMAQKYRVAPGKSIMIPSNQSLPTAPSGILRGGMEVPNSLIQSFGKGELERKIQGGYILKVGSEPLPTAKPLGGMVPGPRMANDAMVESEMPTTSGKGESASVTGDAGITTSITKNPVSEGVETVESPWTFDPEKLEGKSLEEMKVMIQERDSKFDLSILETADDAILQLSEHFRSKA